MPGARPTVSARSAFERFWFGEAPPARLAWLRILIGGYAVFYLISRFGAFTNVVRFHALEFTPVGPTTLLAAPLDAPWVFASMALSIALGIAFFLGFRFRVSGPAFALALLANLAEEPGITDDAAADHESVRTGEREDFVGLVDGVDIAVRQHWALHLGDGVCDEVVPGRAAIHLFHCSRVDGE